MTYSVSILLRARQDVQQIFAWLAVRSEQGAQSWFESFESSFSLACGEGPVSGRQGLPRCGITRRFEEKLR